MTAYDESFWVVSSDGRPMFGSRPPTREETALVLRLVSPLEHEPSGSVELRVEGHMLTGWRLVAHGAEEAQAYAVRVRRVRPDPVAAHALESLTPRQRAVCEFATVGATVEEIAVHLGISPGTVRTHLKAVYRNLGVSNRVELARALGQLDMS